MMVRYGKSFLERASDTDKLIIIFNPMSVKRGGKLSSFVRIEGQGIPSSPDLKGS